MFNYEYPYASKKLTLVKILSLFNLLDAYFPRFDLDPNRVLDLVLETWQNYLDKSEFFLQLVKLFPKQDDALCRMLGYSFAFYEVLFLSKNFSFISLVCQILVI